MNITYCIHRYGNWYYICLLINSFWGAESASIFFGEHIQRTSGNDNIDNAFDSGCLVESCCCCLICFIRLKWCFFWMWSGAATVSLLWRLKPTVCSSRRDMTRFISFSKIFLEAFFWDKRPFLVQCSHFLLGLCSVRTCTSEFNAHCAHPAGRCGLGG